MQKLGLLYLHDGKYDGRVLLSRAWVREAFTPVVKTSDREAFPSYGAYFRTVTFGPHVAHVAQGWKGQRIAVLRKERLVVTMTGIVEPPEDETVLFRRVLDEYVLPAAQGRPDPSLRPALAEALARIGKEAHWPKKPAESRMVPSAAPKERHHRFAPD
jgi:hypothetical protein